MTREETVRNLLTELIDMIDNGSQRDLDRADEISTSIIKLFKQESRWIPVSEKLPEPFTNVNATCRSLVDDRENWVVETFYLPIPKDVNKHGYSDWGNIPMLNCGEAEVIAWVERIIPQPCKAEIEPQESEG